MALVSAHRCGLPRGADDAALREALAAIETLACEYVEIDVQRTADGAFVVRHDPMVVVDGQPRAVAGLTLAQVRAGSQDVVSLDEALRMLAGRKLVHLDLKLASPVNLYDASPESTHEVEATRIAVREVGADALVITSTEDRGIAAVRAWSRTTYPDLLVGLTLGRSRAEEAWHLQLAGRLSDLFPGRRLTACDASLVAANHWLAWLSVARQTARRGLPLLVWTVDGRRGLTRWLRDRRTWVVTTNQPARALEIREQSDES